jgi:ppGpp synthetase/RelA/SpoT-type nucleotidyltranferase
MSEADGGFDFAAHGQAAIAEYLKRQAFYADLASVVKRILEESNKRRTIRVHSVEGRAKEPASLGRKAAQPSEADPTKPRYSNPLEDIADLAGVRVITYFPSTLAEIDTMLREEFRVVEQSDKGAELLEEERFGYQSIHYLVRLSHGRSRLPEYERFADTVAEIQVHTILQHAWAEIEHDIQYKSVAVIPLEIRRRFMSVAGMLEIADREFQAIQDADVQLTKDARSRVEGGELGQVEITPDALKAFLDKRLGPDNRIADFSYDWTARLLKRLGFRTLEQVDICIRGYDDDVISRSISGTRQGQTTRFEFMRLAGMGDCFVQRHFFAKESWFDAAGWLKELRKTGVEVRSYDPLTDGREDRSTDQAAPSPADAGGVASNKQMELTKKPPSIK